MSRRAPASAARGPDLRARGAALPDWFASARAGGGPTFSYVMRAHAAARGRPITGIQGAFCTGPLEYVGHAEVQADIDNLKAAGAGVDVKELCMTALAPTIMSYFLKNEYYSTDRDFLFAVAEAMNTEYRAIADSGILLQLDEPAILTDWHWMTDATVADYRTWLAVQVEALNVALRGIPPERVRMHSCWGSIHHPHTDDIPLADVVDLMLQVNVGAYSIEASNPRHDHEWEVWQQVKLPEGKTLIPGVIGHFTDYVEHPRLVAERIVKYARVVGRENVIAGVDCGLGTRVGSESIQWAKFAALAEGARLASQRSGETDAARLPGAVARGLQRIGLRYVTLAGLHPLLLDEASERGRGSPDRAPGDGRLPCADRSPGSRRHVRVDLYDGPARGSSGSVGAARAGVQLLRRGRGRPGPRRPCPRGRWLGRRRRPRQLDAHAGGGPQHRPAGRRRQRNLGRRHRAVGPEGAHRAVMSLAHLLGATRDAVPIYGSGGFTSYSDAELAEQLGGWVQQGIPRVKMKIGTDWGSRPETDVHRVAVARQAIGPRRGVVRGCQWRVLRQAGHRARRTIQPARRGVFRGAGLQRSPGAAGASARPHSDGRRGRRVRLRPVVLPRDAWRARRGRAASRRHPLPGRHRLAPGGRPGVGSWRRVLGAHLAVDPCPAGSASCPQLHTWSISTTTPALNSSFSTALHNLSTASCSPTRGDPASAWSSSERTPSSGGSRDWRIAMAVVTEARPTMPTPAAPRFPTPRAQLEADLRAHIRGEVRFDDGSRALYSTDASNYRQVPIGVVVPRDIR